MLIRLPFLNPDTASYLSSRTKVLKMESEAELWPGKSSEGEVFGWCRVLEDIGRLDVVFDISCDHDRRHRHTALVCAPTAHLVVTGSRSRVAECASSHFGGVEFETSSGMCCMQGRVFSVEYEIIACKTVEEPAEKLE